MTSLIDRSLFITGAASGIGEACAELGAQAGAKLLLTDVDEAAGEALAARLRESGAHCIFSRCDVSKEDEVEAALALCAETYGRVDCAINNAGITGVPSALQDTPLAQWQSILDVNLTGVFLCIKHELRHMKAQGGGAIVNVASGAGVMAVPNMVPYCASKHGVLGITKTAVQETIKDNIRINAVLPGSTRTAQMDRTISMSEDVRKMVMASVPCGRLGEPEEQARAILWLLSDEASYVNGEAMAVDGGTTNR